MWKTFFWVIKSWKINKTYLKMDDNVKITVMRYLIAINYSNYILKKNKKIFYNILDIFCNIFVCYSSKWYLFQNVALIRFISTLVDSHIIGTKMKPTLYNNVRFQGEPFYDYFSNSVKQQKRSCRVV